MKPVIADPLLTFTAPVLAGEGGYQSVLTQETINPCAGRDYLANGQ